MKTLAAFSFRYDPSEIKLFFDVGFLWFFGNKLFWTLYENNNMSVTRDGLIEYHRQAANWLEVEL